MNNRPGPFDGKVKKCKKARGKNKETHEPHTWRAGVYYPTGEVDGYLAQCPGYVSPPPKGLSLDDLLYAVREIYHDACICHLDHGSPCYCKASYQSRTLLDRLEAEGIRL